MRSIYTQSFQANEHYKIQTVINHNEMIIGQRFQLNNKINSGSFGEIHLALDLKTKQTVAVKMEPINCKHPQLEYQAKLLAYLTDQIEPRKMGLPRLYFYGKIEKFHVMVMDLLGPSLEQLFQKCNKKFDLKTVVMVGIQIMERLKNMHKKKFIHRDIKPENFLLGMNQHCGTVFMIDLGLSKKYIQKNGEHIRYRDDRSLKGTPRYTSLNSHLGIEQSRRDDLQSVVYMLIYFLKGQLPWQNLKQDANYDRYEKILEKKLSVSVENLCHGLPHQFNELVEYTRGLHFIEEPNYQHIKNLLEQALTDAGGQIRPNDLFCWEKTQEELQEEKLKLQKSSSIKKSSDSAFKFQQKDSLFSKQDEFHQFNPFDTKFEQKPRDSIKQAKKQDSLEFNPFDASKRKNTEEDDMFGAFDNQRNSLEKSQDDPFQSRNPQENHYDNDPFSQRFQDFEKGHPGNHYKSGKNESFDDPFGDFKDPEIVQL